MTVISSLSASLAFRLIDPAANPAILVVGLGTIAIVVVVVIVIIVIDVVIVVVIVIVIVVVIVVVSDAGDDVLADCEEVVIMVKHPLDTFGCVTFAGVECCDKFFTEV